MQNNNLTNSTKNHKWRSQFHLEPDKGWMNDPNGLCFFGGKYHVFFQYAPETPDGSGLKSWGHFIGKSLADWSFAGEALIPDNPDDKDGVYSGSAVVSDGLMHIFYTGNVKENGDHDFIKSGRGANVIHVTSADGKCFSEKKTALRNMDYPDFVSCHVRDPKVWRDEKSGCWKMVLGARTLSDKGCVLIYKSSDLDNWSFEKSISTSEVFGYMWECPDIFELDGKTFLSVSPQGLEHFDTKYQNLFQSGYFPLDEKYEPGCFTEWDSGFDFYAPQTFLAPDGRRILIGWMGIGDNSYTNATTAFGWQHCLTVPREITLKNNKLYQNPASEITSLRTRGMNISDGTVCEITLPFDMEAITSDSFCISLGNDLRLCYSKAAGLFNMEFSNGFGKGRTRRTAELKTCNSIRILCDTSSSEVYLNGGELVMSTRFYPDENKLLLTASGIDGFLYPMKAMEVKF